MSGVRVVQPFVRAVKAKQTVTMGTKLPADLSVVSDLEGAALETRWEKMALEAPRCWLRQQRQNR